ncbi:hypothetical protein CLV35_1629 [Motilibacter peucedani]|uniref:Uncharacterized protein n=1 Tax=Motilibacter peucedani TaxID=598650 RepID=A0A420XSS5_9ACTN|nr:hypothetical protein [Motilibacter peucedani]RKS77926.1 hypothetical protein CLV35_1629 [Motilibacter peucedani]
MSDDRLSSAFTVLDDELRRTRPHRGDTAPWTRAALVRRRRATASGAVVAVCAVIAGGAVVHETRGSGRDGVPVVVGDAPSAASTPVAAPCPDQHVYSTTADAIPRADLPAADPAMAGHLLSPADLGWPAGTKADSGRGLPGTADASAYTAADWADSSVDSAGGVSWNLTQEVARMAPGKAEAAYATAAALLTCTTPDHVVEVMTASPTTDPQWVGAKTETAVSDDGGTAVEWIVVARSGDLVTRLSLNAWGKDVAMYDAHLPAAWFDSLARAAADRLTGTAPAAPLGTP